MFISIRYKLFGTLLLAAVLVVISMSFLIHWSFGRGFLQYINTEESKRVEALASQLEKAYASQGDWSFLEGNFRLWRRFLAASAPEGPQQFDPMEDQGLARDLMRERRPPARGHRMRQRPRTLKRTPKELRHLFEFRVALFDSNNTLLAGPADIPPQELRTFPVKVDSTAVGFLGYLPQKHLFAEHQRQFVQKQKKSFALIALLIATIAALLALPLASRLLRRIHALAGATHLLAAGKFETRLAVGPNDELGALIQDFNSLGLTLKKNEQGRRQWFADISHELRTPLAVLQGEIEALQDGIHSPTPETLASLHSELMRLKRIVDDLFQLSLSDMGALSYRKETVDVAQLLDHHISQFQPECAKKDIALDVRGTTGKSILLFADPERLGQLFDNLLKNSVRYTDTGGKIQISCAHGTSHVTILFEDSAPGVPTSDIPRLFERLFRADKSRNRESGGAGLGLAICRNIVEAHAGTIDAAPSSLGGLAIHIHFPVRELQ